MERFADVVNKSKITSGAINYIWEVTGKLGGFGNDGWYNDSNEAANEADYENIGKGNWKIAGFARDNASDTVDKRFDGEREEKGAANN